STARGAITADWKEVTVEEALTEACRQIGAAWKRVYIPPGTAVNADNVSQIYRNLRALVAGGLVVLDPQTGRGTVLLLNTPLPNEYREVMEAPNTGFRRAYLVLREHVPLVPAQLPPDDGHPWQPGEPLTPAKMARLQADTLAALSRMSPEERQAALRAAAEAQMAIFAQNPQLLTQFVRETAGMQTQILTQHPELMQGVMQSAVQAQIEAMQQMTPEQRQEMVRAQQEMMRQIPPEQLRQLIELMRPPHTP
ncbi:MAG: hypothetical protein QHJ73_03930, partial [Armatimonadota bacterium]|nr:hypothetical protein [Armatimonadota bacterium]